MTWRAPSQLLQLFGSGDGHIFQIFGKHCGNVEIVECGDGVGFGPLPNEIGLEVGVIL